MAGLDHAARPSHSGADWLRQWVSESVTIKNTVTNGNNNAKVTVAMDTHGTLRGGGQM